MGKLDTPPSPASYEGIHPANGALPMRTLRFFSLLAFVLVLGSCASGAGGTSRRSNPDLITLEELETLPTATAFEAISRLRPRWIQTRMNEEPVVFMDGSRLGGVDVLHNVQVSQLREIRHRNGRDATTRYGTGYGGGSIEMRSRAD